jgi:hypothetical protein
MSSPTPEEEVPNFSTRVVYTLQDLRAQSNSIENDVDQIELELSGKINKDIINAKGDLIVGVASASASILPVGDEGFALVAASAEPGGVKWAVPEAGAKGGGEDKVFWENDIEVTENYTITTNKNAGSFGPIEIATGATVEIPEGSVWIIL